MLHLVAIAREMGVPLDLADFDRVNARVPVFADLKPGGRFVATDLYAAGGTKLVAQRLLDGGRAARRAPSRSPDGRSRKRPRPRWRPRDSKSCVRPASPLKPSGGLVILTGNLAPDGCVVKLSGHDRKTFRGPARVFDSEEAAFAAVQGGRINAGDAVIIRYEGPRGGPGMREMLAVTGAIVGARAQRFGDADYRRTLLRRHARIHGRPRRAGSGERRADCRRP